MYFFQGNTYFRERNTYFFLPFMKTGCKSEAKRLVQADDPLIFMTTDSVPVDSPAPVGETVARSMITARSFGVGLLLAAGLAGLNSWIETFANVHFLGGVQMPLGAVFSLGLLVILVNGPLKRLRRAVPLAGRVLPPFSRPELLSIYIMALFAALISTPGCDDFFLTTGPALFYFSTRENRWADTFYRFIPPQFAPGWNGHTFQARVVEPLYLGGLTWSQVPWHAWVVMLCAWGVLLLLVYALLFFTSLLLRRQWIEHEALNFPLLQLPLQMTDDGGDAPPSGAFWNDKTMWLGAGVAGFFLLLRGLNSYSPDWPTIPSLQGNPFILSLEDVPWNSMGPTRAEFFFGAIGIAYLLSRELSFSFWFFFLAFKLQLVGATMLGFPSASLPRDTYQGNPTFLMLQSVGGWGMTAVMLLWSARGHFTALWHAAIGRPSRTGRVADEPFSPRFVLLGLLLSSGGVLLWCWYCGISILPAIAFFGFYGLVSVALARLVVEGGFLFPQTTFAPLEVLAGTAIGVPAMGAATLTRLSFVQPMLFSDMRTNLLPGFLHALKIAYELHLRLQRAAGAFLVRRARPQGRRLQVRSHRSRAESGRRARFVTGRRG